MEPDQFPEAIAIEKKSYFGVLLVIILALTFTGVAGAFYFMNRPVVSDSISTPPPTTGCDDLTGENRDRCLIVLAGNSGGIPVCNKIVERQRNRNFCNSLVTDPKFKECRVLTDFGNIQRCVSHGIDNNQSSPTSDSCEILSAGRDNCYASLAPKLKDYSLCERVVHKTDSSNYESCRMGVAVALGDENGCQNLGQYYRHKDGSPDYFFKSICLIGIASAKKDARICDLVPENTDDDPVLSRNACLGSVKECIKDPRQFGCTNNPEHYPVGLEILKTTQPYQATTVPLVPFSGNPHADLRYKDKTGVRFELQVGRPPPLERHELFEFIKENVPENEIITTSIFDGNLIRGLAGHEVVAHLPSLEMTFSADKTIAKGLRGGDLDQEGLDGALDRVFNLSKDDTGNFNLQLTPGAVAQDLGKIYSTGDPKTIYDLMAKHHSRYIVVLGSHEQSNFPDDTVVVNRMFRGQVVSCFSLLKNVTESRKAGNNTTIVRHLGSLYEVGDTCMALPTSADLSGKKPLWEDDFNQGAASWTSASSFMKEKPDLLARVVSENKTWEMSFPEYRSGVVSLDKKMTFPVGAKYMTFDFYFQNPSGNETFLVRIGNTTVFDQKASDWKFSQLQTSPVIDISAYAGSTGDLHLNFQGDGDAEGNRAGAKLYLDNVRIY
ncbi:MAG: hypothetical protein AAB364_03490 [Patescibacteria group bacterium]